MTRAPEPLALGPVNDLTHAHTHITHKHSPHNNSKPGIDSQGGYLVNTAKRECLLGPDLGLVFKFPASSPGQPSGQGWGLPGLPGKYMYIIAHWPSCPAHLANRSGFLFSDKNTAFCRIFTIYSRERPIRPSRPPWGGFWGVNATF